MRPLTTLQSPLVLSFALATKLHECNSRVEVSKFKLTAVASLKAALAAKRSPLSRRAFLSRRSQTRLCHLAERSLAKILVSAIFTYLNQNLRYKTEIYVVPFNFNYSQDYPRPWHPSVWRTL